MLNMNLFFKTFLSEDSYARSKGYRNNRKNVWLMLEDSLEKEPEGLQLFTLMNHCDEAILDLLTEYPEWMKFFKPWQLEYLYHGLQRFILKAKESDDYSKKIPGAIAALIQYDETCVLRIFDKYFHWLHQLEIKALESIHAFMSKNNFPEQSTRKVQRYLQDRKDIQQAVSELLDGNSQSLPLLKKKWQVSYLYRSLEQIAKSEDPDCDSKMIKAINGLLRYDRSLMLTILTKYPLWLNFLNINALSDGHQYLLENDFPKESGRQFCRYLLERLKTHELVHKPEFADEKEFEPDTPPGISPC
ncbi:hypothetical protein [Legionella genomosp. 1]|uniref:hypothetical protein n=1 Tax=Legionella genomosp. 1 TaxID=1093625 RepID=UPI001054A94E|nr:hypothetical protein [Legionella genomosp. 1]